MDTRSIRRGGWPVDERGLGDHGHCCSFRIGPSTRRLFAEMWATMEVRQGYLLSAHSVGEPRPFSDSPGFKGRCGGTGDTEASLRGMDGAMNDLWTEGSTITLPLAETGYNLHMLLVIEEVEPSAFKWHVFAVSPQSSEPLQCDHPIGGRGAADFDPVNQPNDSIRGMFSKVQDARDAAIAWATMAVFSGVLRASSR